MVFSIKKETKGVSQKVSNKKNDYKNRKVNSVSKKRNPKKNKSKRSLRKKKKKGGSAFNFPGISYSLKPNFDNLPVVREQNIERLTQEKEAVRTECSSLVKEAKDEAEQKCKQDSKAEIQKIEKTCSELVKRAEQKCKQDSEAACQQSLTEAQEDHSKKMEEKKKEGLTKLLEGLVDATCESMGSEHCAGIKPEMDSFEKFNKVMDSIQSSLNSCNEKRERLNQELLIETQEKQKRESDIKKATKFLEKSLDLSNEQDLKYEHVLGEEIEKTWRLEKTGEIKKKVQKCSNDSVIECELLEQLRGGKSLEPILLVRNNDGSLFLRKKYKGEIVKIESDKINFMLPVEIKYPEKETILEDEFFGLHFKDIRPSQLLIINSSSEDGNFVSNYFIMNEAMSPFLKEFLEKKNKVFVNSITLDEDIRKLIHEGVVPVNVELILKRIQQHRENFGLHKVYNVSEGVNSMGNPMGNQRGSSSHRSLKKSTRSRKLSMKKRARQY